jgi:hypothetical protein
MNDPLCKYHTFLFINGAQVGDNTTFADWYADDAAVTLRSQAPPVAPHFQV